MDIISKAELVCSKCEGTKGGMTMRDGAWICKYCINMEKYKARKPGYFLCKICGKADNPNNWIGGLPEGLCFYCAFWTEKLEEYNKGAASKVVVIAGHMYYIGEEKYVGDTAYPTWRGFGGRRFKIHRFDTDETIETTNLWHNGVIPDRFRDQLPDTAKFV
jgi:hypothetical protein